MLCILRSSLQDAYSLLSVQMKGPRKYGAEAAHIRRNVLVNMSSGE